jgi:ATP-dependent Lhr-like helicase
VPLDAFTPAVRQWFTNAFERPTEVQAQAWPAIATGEHTLISAPTGSGKTLAAFLWGLDKLAREPADHTRLVYVSPLKALAYDVDRNLRAPLRGIGADLSVAIRTGDTPQKERAAMRRTPPDILITTPESLYLVLTSQAREMLLGVDGDHPRRDPRGRVDQARLAHGAHARAALGAPGGRARGPAHRPERDAEPARGGRPLHGRPAAHVQGHRRGVRKPLDLRIQVPVESMVEPEQSTGALDPLDPLVGGEATRKSIWPAIYPELLKLVHEHRSTIVFVNNRRGAERLALRPERAAQRRARGARRGRAGPSHRARPPRLARPGGAHGGRGAAQVGRAAVPGGHLVARARHRHGRRGPRPAGRVAQVRRPRPAAHRPRRPQRRRHLQGPDLPEVPRRPARVRVVVRLMREGRIEPTVVPRNALDVLAQQIVAIVASADPEPVAVDDLHALVTRTHSYAELSRELLENVLDMLDGRYPSQEFGDLRPRLVWDRVGGTLRAARAPARSPWPTRGRSPTAACSP